MRPALTVGPLPLNSNLESRQEELQPREKPLAREIRKGAQVL